MIYYGNCKGGSSVPNISDNLCIARMTKNISTKEAATRLQISEKTYLKLEAGEIEVGVYFTNLIVDKLGISSSDLNYGCDNIELEELLETFRRLNEQNRNKFMNTIEKLYKGQLQF